jgi:hypothetical protein
LKYSDPKECLYANYLAYCKAYGHKPLLFNVFSVVLLQQLNTLINPNITKTRERTGTRINNIKLNKDILNNQNQNKDILNNKDQNNALYPENDIINEFSGYLMKE